MHLVVWLCLPDGSWIQAGDLATTDPDPVRGAMRGEFRYHPDYLGDGRAFSLDPAHLPLGPGIFVADRPRSGVHAVFEDSLPDDWGRGLLVRRYAIPRGQQRVPALLRYLGTCGLGALGYLAPGVTPKSLLGSEASLPDIPALVRAADRHLRGVPTDDTRPDEFDLLFRAGSSPGGARPKALIEHDGCCWIAKFPSGKDAMDIVRIESATLALARRAGMNVPDFQVVEVGSTCALLVRRFDLPGGRLGSGRYHMISLGALLGAENYYQAGYEDIATTLREHSCRPEIDLPALFRMAVFNAVIGNTDDHLKNFSMLYDESGWRLAPAYDLLPDINNQHEHVLHFGLHGHNPDRGALLDLAGRAGVSLSTATKIIHEVSVAVASWDAVFASHGVPRSDIERLSASISARLRRIADADPGDAPVLAP